jgi:hypothetical protein
MSENLAAAAQALSAPETIVRRSAEAKAKATGATVDSILTAWAGGGTVAAPAVSEPAPTPAAPVTTQVEPAPAAAPAPVAAPAAPVVETPTTVAVMEPPPAPVIAAPLSNRLRIATRVGAVGGLMMGLMGWVFASQYLLNKASLAVTETAGRPTLEVPSDKIVLVGMLVSVPIGLLIAGAARVVPGWIAPGMRLRSGPVPTAAVGILGGGLVGALAAAIVSGNGTPLEAVEGVTSLPVVSSLLWSMAVWAGGGWLVGALVQALGVPDGVEEAEAEEVVSVRARLVSAYGIPVLAVLAILTLVLSFAFVFLSFPKYAPLTGTILAGSILGFAGLSASKPTMRVGVSELIVAAAGIGVAVILVYAVLNTTGAGHSEGGSSEVTTETTVAPGAAALGG